MSVWCAARNRQADRAYAWGVLLVVALGLGLSSVLGRVLLLKVSGGPDGAGAAVSSRVERSRRGDLTDRRGRVLATSTLGWRLFVDPAELDDPATTAIDLAGLIHEDAAEIARRIRTAASRRYVVIADEVDEATADAVRTRDLAGVGLEPRLVRHYPHGDLAGPVLGTVGTEHTGLSGAEHLLDDRLAQRDGRLRYVRDPRRRALWFAGEEHEPARDGRDVHLTIDLVVQRLAERRLDEAIAKHRAAGGRLIVLDVTDGSILAMADRLNPDPPQRVHLRDETRAVDPGLGRNRCATDPYEPGSTFKPFVWAAATELGLAAPDEVLPTPGHEYYRTSRGRRIRDTHMIESATWRACLLHSLNSGMAIVAERMTEAQLQEVIGRFGFGAPTRCGVAGESDGLVTAPAEWSHYTQTSVPMGHEIAVTALQMVRAFAVFARDGSMPSLRLVEPDGAGFAPAFRRQVLSPQNARLVRQVLRQVVTEGSGRPARSDKYRIWGKSGTPQLHNPDDGGYYENRYVPTFIAGAPLEDPRVVVLCVIDDPVRSTGHFGGPVAGPVVRDVIEQTLEYLGVPRDG